jgi:2-C-methyl-D-erythritol 4-phosphate cytidylyltransferase
MFITTIIVAAGKGKRFGGKKQFFKLCGKPVVAHSVEKFLRFSDEIIVVLESGDLKRFLRLLPSRKGCVIKAVAGGRERYDSVMAGLKNVSPLADVVCIHDGARPLVRPQDIKRCIEAAAKYGAAVCAAPASDTIKYAKDGFVKSTLDRSRIFLAQTPQAFKKDVIVKAYALLRKGGLSGITDDAMAAEMTGTKVKIVECDASNIKITRKRDIKIAEALLCPKK